MSNEVFASADDFDLDPPPADLSAAAPSLPAGADAPATDVTALWEQYQQMREQFDALGKALSERVGPAELPAGQPGTPMGIDITPASVAPPQETSLDFGPPLPAPPSEPFPEIPPPREPIAAPDSSSTFGPAIPMPSFEHDHFPSAPSAVEEPDLPVVSEMPADFAPGAVPMPDFGPAAPQETDGPSMPDFGPATSVDDAFVPASVPMPDFGSAAALDSDAPPIPEFGPTASSDGPGAVPMPDFGASPMPHTPNEDFAVPSPSFDPVPAPPTDAGLWGDAASSADPRGAEQAPSVEAFPASQPPPFTPAGDDPYARLSSTSEPEWNGAAPTFETPAAQSHEEPQGLYAGQEYAQDSYDHSAALDNGQHAADPGAFLAQDVLVMMAEHGADSQATVRQEVAFGKIREGARQGKQDRTKKRTKGKGKPRFLDISTRFIDQIPLVICVTSPKGGVGKSTSAANLAALFAKSAAESGRDDIRVLLVDGDVANGNLALRVAQRLEPNMLDMLIHKDELQRRGMEMDDYKRDIGKWVLAHPDLDNLDILAAPDNPEVLGEIEQRDLKELMAAWSRHFQIVVIDSGTQIVEQPNQAWMSFASQVYLMVEPEIACLQVTAEFVKRAQMFKLLTREKCRVVCIRADMDLADLDPQKVISEVFSFIPSDRQFFVPDFHRDGIEAANAGEFLALESAEYARHMLPIAKAALESYERDYGMNQ